MIKNSVRRILVLDGQGGGIGSQLVKLLIPKSLRRETTFDKEQSK